MRSRLHSPALNAFEIEGSRDLLTVEEVLHDQKVGFGLSRAGLKITDLNSVEAQEFCKYRWLVGRGIHIPEVRGA